MKILTVTRTNGEREAFILILDFLCTLIMCTWKRGVGWGGWNVTLLTSLQSLSFPCALETGRVFCEMDTFTVLSHQCSHRVNQISQWSVSTVLRRRRVNTNELFIHASFNARWHAARMRRFLLQCCTKLSHVTRFKRDSRLPVFRLDLFNTCCKDPSGSYFLPKFTSYCLYGI